MKMLTTSTSACSRRRFLLLAVAALAGCRLPGQGEPGLAQARGGEFPELPAWLRQVTGDPASVTRIGRAYLRTAPRERSLAPLLDALEQRLAAETDLATPQDTASLLVALQRLVRREYAAGELVMAGRWLLSRSEARLYAAVALAGFDGDL
jgi:hypothetical protein